MKRQLLVATAIMASLLLAGCRGGVKKAAANGKQTAKYIQVKVSKAKKERVAEIVDFTANLRAFKQNFVVPAMGARIERIYAEVGDKVGRNQLLVDLDKTQYNQYALQLANAESNLSRMKQVYETGGISKQQIDELETSIGVLRETVANFRKNLELRSPVSGIVTGRYNEEGDLFTMAPNAAGGIGILQVMQIDQLKAYVGVSEQYFTQVKMGMPVSITTDVYPDKEFAGTVTRLSPSVNSSTRTFEVEVTIPNRSEILRPGMFARTTFNMGEVEGITVDDLAIQRQAGTNDKYVFVVEVDPEERPISMDEAATILGNGPDLQRQTGTNDKYMAVVERGTAVKRPVKAGRQMGSRVEIVSGLNDGDEVVVAGMSKLTNGSPVYYLTEI